MGSKRDSQRLAIILKQTQKTMEINQADAPTWLARGSCAQGGGYGREYPQGDAGGQSVLLVASRGGSGVAAIRAVVLPREMDDVRRFQPRPQAQGLQARTLGHPKNPPGEQWSRRETDG